MLESRIIPEYDKYFIKEDILAHSYPNNPPLFSSPEILYYFHYEGFLLGTQWGKNFNWSIEPPFYIVAGQGTSRIACELIPKLTTQQEPIKTGSRQLIWRDYDFRELNLELGTAGKFKSTLNLYYKQGPLWKIEGNKNPKINTVETYTLIPQYDQTGHPPKNTTDPNSYSFNIKNGRVVNFHGGIPPIGNPLVDILWYQSGPTYLSFNSTWTNEVVKFPNTINIYVS